MSKAFERLKSSYKEGDYVYRDGDLGTEMFIVQSGRIHLVKEVFGRQEVIAKLEKGDFFGEMAVLENLPRTNGAQVVEAAEVIAINGSTFDKMIKSNIEIAVRMLRKFSDRLRDADGETLRLRERNRELHDKLSQAPAAVAAVGSTVASPPPPAAPPVTAAAAAAPLVAVPPPAAVVPPPLHTPVVAKSPPVQRPQPPAPDPAAIPAPAARRLTLVVKGSERRQTIQGSEVTIGRADPVTGLRPDVDLTEEDVNRFISRRHAKILLKDDTYYLVEEVGVTNGTYVNGKRLQAGVYTSIHPGDELCFGKVFLSFLEEG